MVLTGGESVLSRISVIFTEVLFEPLYKDSGLSGTCKNISRSAALNFAAFPAWCMPPAEIYFKQMRTYRQVDLPAKSMKTAVVVSSCDQFVMRGHHFFIFLRKIGRIVPILFISSQIMEFTVIHR